MDIDTLRAIARTLRKMKGNATAKDFNEFTNEVARTIEECLPSNVVELKARTK